MPFKEATEGMAVDGFIVGRDNDRGANRERQVELEHGNVKG